MKRSIHYLLLLICLKSFGQNLIKNGSCDLPLIQNKIPNWVYPSEINFKKRDFDPLPFEGLAYFSSGDNNNYAEIYQDIDISDLKQRSLVDSVSMEFSGYVRSWPQEPPDQSNVIFYMKRNQLDSVHLGPFSEVNFWKKINYSFSLKSVSSLRIKLLSIRRAGENNDGYYDALTLKAKIFKNQLIKLCTNGSILVGSHYYSKNGVYFDTLTSMLGWDSIVTTTIQVLDVSQFSQTKYLCKGKSFPVADTSYSTPGTFVRKAKTRLGCDSLITTTIIVVNADTTHFNSTLCKGKSITVGNKIYSTSAIDTIRLSNRYGCDSTVFLNLTAIEPKRGSRTFTVCKGETVFDAGKEFTQAGEFETVLTAQSTGCDSIHTTIVKHIEIDIQTSPKADTLVEYSQAVALTTFASGENLEYSWEPEEMVDCSTCPKTQTKPIYKNTVFVATARDTVYNCIGSKSFKISIKCPIEIPNLVTPNEDSHNDVWSLNKLNCFSNVSTLKIFNRWGKEIFSKSDFIPVGQIELWSPRENDLYFFQLRVAIVEGQPETFVGWLEVR